MNHKIPVLLISGPVGVSKSVVGGEVAEILERNKNLQTFIDFDQIRYTYPRPDDDPWGERLGLENLTAIGRNRSRSGSLNLIVSYVVEHASFIDMLLDAIPEGDVSTVQLTADLETLKVRLIGREVGSGLKLKWHINRAGELTSSLATVSTPCDFRINTERRVVTHIAEEIVSKVTWRLN